MQQPRADRPDGVRKADMEICLLPLIDKTDWRQVVDPCEHRAL
jgi:hypothetical protein